LRSDGEIEIWASNYSAYRLSFSDTTIDQNNNELISAKVAFREKCPTGIGGTLESIPKNFPKIKAEDGTLYYIFSDEESEKGYKTTIRIISPWKLSETMEAFNYQGNLESIVNSKGMIIVNMGKIKREIDAGIEKLG